MSKHITIQNIIDATGLSRTTVYRKINDDGMSREELLGSAPGAPDSPDEFEEPPDDKPIDPDDTAALTWCRAVVWASENMHEKKMTEKKAGSKIRYSMWQSSEKYPKEMLIQLVPKALQILDRNKDSGTSAETADAERKSVVDLRELLAGALEESKSITP